MAGSVAVPVGHDCRRLVEGLCQRRQAMKVGPTDGGAAVDMGPLITPSTSRQRRRLSRVGRERRGRGRARRPRAFDLPRTAFCSARASSITCGPDMRWRAKRSSGRCCRSCAPAISTRRWQIGRQCDYGNGASIFTRSGWAARQFKRHFNAGMIGINVGVPAPMAWFPFTGWNKSFFGDLHIQGTEGVQFYTQQKMTMTRWFETRFDSHHDPVWKSGKT